VINKFLRTNYSKELRFDSYWKQLFIIFYLLHSRTLIIEASLSWEQEDQRKKIIKIWKLINCTWPHAHLNVHDSYSAFRLDVGMWPCNIENKLLFLLKLILKCYKNRWMIVILQITLGPNLKCIHDELVYKYHIKGLQFDFWVWECVLHTYSTFSSND
jgi:hypothetical protein